MQRTNWQYQDGGPAGRGCEEGVREEGEKRPGLSLGLELARGDRVDILLGREGRGEHHESSGFPRMSSPTQEMWPSQGRGLMVNQLREQALLHCSGLSLSFQLPSFLYTLTQEGPCSPTKNFLASILPSVPDGRVWSEIKKFHMPHARQWTPRRKGGGPLLIISPSLGTSCLTLGSSAFLSPQGSPLEMTRREVDTHPPSFTLIGHEIFVTK